MNVSLTFAVDTTEHVEHDRFYFEDTITINGLEDLRIADHVHGGTTGNNIRNCFADYFMSEAGAFP
ncbi:hypothetical protein PR048_016500 [Dryococelus australis]|uniref:Uncharacterized protein n=1 Tax=Dryococelus australis TaxID=614101 RepID=A0ABQ9HJY2_9NEOP|nr:hypothetical protein PR048_016500 [Dryococelus australis]